MRRFLTITAATEGFYKEKGSKFLSFAYPVSSDEEVKEKLDTLRKQFFDARHHCFAYTTGIDAERYRANDDGEPGHSAGDPILGQIRSRNLTNTLVVVVRYFGGTKLGVGGLIAAYKIAAADALDKAKVVEVSVTDTIKLYFPYERTSEVMRLVKEFNVNIKEQTFTESCSLTGDVEAGTAEVLKEKISLIEAVKIEIVPPVYR